MICARVLPSPIMRSMSRRRGTANPQVGMLQLATVKPQPHWQVKPSKTSVFVVVSDANVSRETFLSSGERKANSTMAMNASRSGDANFERTMSVTPGCAEVGEFARVGGRAAERGRDCGALAHVGPHYDHGAEHHQQASCPQPENQRRQEHFEGRGLTAVVDSGEDYVEVA